MTPEMRARLSEEDLVWIAYTVAAIKDWGVGNCRRILAHDLRFE
ncbi:hypothetical protein LCGC14_2809860 [marine sediment metagenome]|uniref:Uncharacterized protein n=1 Tax=marine sediment metagenome TaxID=412755 RepID=A0A0F8YK61_9ZZZZ